MSKQITTLGKHGLEIEIYKETISLVATYQGKDGKFYAKWGKEKIGKDSYSDSARPFKIVLGDHNMALKTLRAILAELEDFVPREPGSTHVPGIDDDSPF